ncbi:MAG: hypothetical protein M0R51_17860 [Clostridia bacterium]|nr:hypothetical protein [Clostridia bacterium]
MNKPYPIKYFQVNYLMGIYESNEVGKQIDAGWYDWFCKDSSLANKTKRMGSIVSQIKRGGKVDIDNCYVWFKNNCPVSYPLYDDFRFASIENSEVEFTTRINCGYEKHRYVVYGRKNGFDVPLFESDSSRELVKWFNTPWEVK